MQRWKFVREFVLEAVSDQRVTVALAAPDQELDDNVQRKRIRELLVDPRAVPFKHMACGSQSGSIYTGFAMRSPS